MQYNRCSYQLIVDDCDQEQRSFYRTRREAIAAWERAKSTPGIFSARLFHTDPRTDRVELIAAQE